MKKLLTLFVIAATAAAASAQSFNFGQIVNWTGTGTNEAALLIDWQTPGTNDPAIVWGYRWSGVATGEEMLDAIVAADPDLSVQLENFGENVVTGFAFDGAPYGLDGQNETGFGDPGWWSYWTGSGPTYPSWSESGVGMGDRVLSDESWDGWSWTTGNGTAPSDQPIAAPVPAPEPASALALAGGLAALSRRRR